MTKINIYLIIIFFILIISFPAIAQTIYNNVYYTISYYIVKEETLKQAIEDGDPYIIDFAAVPVYRSLALYNKPGDLRVANVYLSLDNRVARQTLGIAEQLTLIPPGDNYNNIIIVYIGNLNNNPESFTCSEALIARGEGYIAYHSTDGTLLYALAIVNVEGDNYHVVTISLTGHPGVPCGSSLRTTVSYTITIASIIVFVAAIYTATSWRKKLDSEVYASVGI